MDDAPMTGRSDQVELRAQIAALKEQRTLGQIRIAELEELLQQALDGHNALIRAASAAQRPLLRRLSEAEEAAKALMHERDLLRARVQELEARLGERS